jgi:hypothetical protein
MVGTYSRVEIIEDCLIDSCAVGFLEPNDSNLVVLILCGVPGHIEGAICNIHKVALKCNLSLIELIEILCVVVVSGNEWCELDVGPRAEVECLVPELEAS